MPSAQLILNHLTIAANEAVAVAIFWHIVSAAAIVAQIIGWRPSARLAGALLAVPIASAAAVAFVFKNPFNGTILGALAMALISLASRFRLGGVVRGSTWASFAGVLMIAFGLFYPHFLVARSPLTYLYAAPTGLIPCPTLAVVIGFALLAGCSQMRAWSLTLAGAGLFYGLFGVAHLGVFLDMPLIGGSVALIVVALSRMVPGQSSGDRLPTTRPRGTQLGDVRVKRARSLFDRHRDSASARRDR